MKGLTTLRFKWLLDTVLVGIITAGSTASLGRTHFGISDIQGSNILDCEAFLGYLQSDKSATFLSFPAFFKDPNLFLQEAHRRAQSGFVVFWNRLSDDQKLTILNVLNDVEDPTFIPFVVEIAYFTLPLENNAIIAASILGALNGSAWPFLDLSIFVTDYIANNATCAEVVEYAQRDLVALHARRQRFGR